MSDLIRLASGDVTAYDLLNTSSYLVINFTRQSDMSASDYWSATQPDKMVQAEFVGGIELGSGGYYGGYSGDVQFFILTPNMRSYLHTTIMASKPVAKVTMTLYNPIDGLSVYTGELVNPYALNAVTEYTPSGYDYTFSNIYRFRNGTRKTVSYLLLENGDNILAENNALVTLETQS